MKISISRIFLITLGAISVGSSFAWTTIGGGDDIDVATGKKMGLDGGTGNNYIIQNGNIVSITENGKMISLPASSSMGGSADTFSLLNTQQAFMQPQIFAGSSGSVSNTNFQSGITPGTSGQEINGFNFQGYDSGGTARVYALLQGISESASTTNWQGGLRYYMVDSPGGAASEYLGFNQLADGKVDVYKDFTMQTNKKLYLDGGSGNYLAYDGSKIKMASTGDICIGSGC